MSFPRSQWTLVRCENPIVLITGMKQPIFPDPLMPPSKAVKPAKKIRILVAKPGLDGHDRGALILCLAFRDAGMEVIYTGFLATPEQVAQMAIDEDVDVVAMSLLNGAHMTAFPKVAKLMRQKGGSEILLVGGGIIPEEDKPVLEKQGITGNYGPGTALKTIIEHVEKIVRDRDSPKSR